MPHYFDVASRRKVWHTRHPVPGKQAPVSVPRVFIHKSTRAVGVVPRSYITHNIFRSGIDVAHDSQHDRIRVRMKCRARTTGIVPRTCSAKRSSAYEYGSRRALTNVSGTGMDALQYPQGV